MHTLIQRASFAALFISIFFSFSAIQAQSAGNSGTIYGTVTDPTGAVIRGASVAIENPVSGYNRHTTSDSTGRYQFTNLPLNPYHLTISAPSFGTISQDADVRSTVPITVNLSLKLGETSTTVEVTTTGQDLIEYALMAAFLAVATAAVMPAVATGVSRLFTEVGSVLVTATTTGS